MGMYAKYTPSSQTSTWHHICTTLTTRCHAQLRMPENAWERLCFFQRVSSSRGLAVPWSLGLIGAPPSHSQSFSVFPSLSQSFPVSRAPLSQSRASQSIARHSVNRAPLSQSRATQSIARHLAIISLSFYLLPAPITPDSTQNRIKLRFLLCNSQKIC